MIHTAQNMTADGKLAGTFDEIADHYDPPSRALTEMVRLIANRLEIDVCSIYILEPEHQHLRLAATMGLNQSSVGHVRMKITEGLAGLVFEENARLSVSSAQDHPRFKYFPEAGEDRFTSFFGVPLNKGRFQQGVLVVQTIDARNFSDYEIDLICECADALSFHVNRCRLVEVD